jgi:hypothetical protein
MFRPAAHCILRSVGGLSNGDFRRISPVAAHWGDRLLSEPTDGVSRRPRHASMMSAGPLSLL